MRSDSWLAVEEAVKSRQLDGLIGLSEDLHFEAKSAEGYDLSMAEGQYELSKDVSALANAEGGWLLIGLVTQRATSEPIDSVAKLDLLEEANFPQAKILGLLKEYVYPSIGGLTVDWCEDVTREGLGIGVVHVPKQPEDKKPFLIAKVVEDGERMKQIVFGYMRRVSDDAIPYTVAQLQNTMKQGMNSTALRLTSIEEKVSLLLEREVVVRETKQAGSLEGLRSLMTMRIDSLLKSRTSRMPYYVLVGAIPPETRLRGFFSSGKESVSWLLTDPPVFRYSGFDVRTGSMARLIEGECWEARNGDRKILRLYQDGVLLFGMRADSDFLAWGENAMSFSDYVRLNPVAVVESHTSFVHLYAAVVRRLVAAPEDVQFFLRFDDAQIGGRRLALSQYYPRGIEWIDNPPLYPVHSVQATSEVALPTAQLLSNPDIAAYTVLAKFYDMCDADEQFIPFSKEIKGDRAVDVEAIKAL